MNNFDSRVSELPTSWCSTKYNSPNCFTKTSVKDLIFSIPALGTKSTSDELPFKNF